MKFKISYDKKEEFTILSFEIDSETHRAHPIVAIAKTIFSSITIIVIVSSLLAVASIYGKDDRRELLNISKNIVDLDKTIVGTVQSLAQSGNK